MRGGTFFIAARAAAAGIGPGAGLAGVLGRAGASDPLAALHQPREAAAVASAVGLYMLAIRVDRAGAALRMSRAVHGPRLDRAVHTLHGHLGAGIVHAAWVACQSSSMLGGMQV